MLFFFFQAEDGIRDLVRSRGRGDVYKRQEDAVLLSFGCSAASPSAVGADENEARAHQRVVGGFEYWLSLSPTPSNRGGCLLYTSDAADERSRVDLGGRRTINKKKNKKKRRKKNKREYKG